MTVIKAMKTTVAAVMTEVAMAAEEFWQWRAVEKVAGKSQKPFGDFIHQRGTVF